MRVEELERRLGEALHAGDGHLVDLRAGRAGVYRRIERGQVVRRRLAVAAVAAVALALSVLIPVLLAGRGTHHDAPPPVKPRPTQIQISPSGLPVGILEMGDVTKFRGPGHDPVRMLVWPDGRGLFRVAPGFATPDDWYEVRLDPVRPGTVAVRYGSPVCGRPPVVLTMSFRLRPGYVDVVDASSPGGCLVSRAQAAGMVGRTWKITPLPARYRHGMPSNRASFGRN